MYGAFPRFSSPARKNCAAGLTQRLVGFGREPPWCHRHAVCGTGRAGLAQKTALRCTDQFRAVTRLAGAGFAMVVHPWLDLAGPGELGAFLREESGEWLEQARGVNPSP